MDRLGARRWLAGAGTTVAIAAWLAAQAGPAGAATAIQAQPAALTAPQVPFPAIAVPGKVYQPPARPLTFGMRGPAVTALQQRLNYLHYYCGKPDGVFGWSTLEAVWAFKEVQSGRRIPPHPDIVGQAMQHQLVNPRPPRALRPHGGSSRIEVNKNLEVLVVYRADKVVLISHVSTADETRPDVYGSVTPDGVYRAWEYVPGPVADSTFGGYMYNPVFFIGTTYAIHGMPDPVSTFSYDGVPLNPASHGCVRIPMDVSLVLHTLIRPNPVNGTRVYVLGPQYLRWS